VTETLENFGSTRSLKVRRISLAEATVPPTAGVAFSSWAWAKAAVAAQIKASEARVRIERLIVGLL
jgi:hypothetical protein